MVGHVMQRRSRVLVAAVLFGPACSAPLGSNPDNACANIAQTYNNAVLKAQECTVGAADQCSVQVPSGFWCNCMTWANGADTLAAIAVRYDAMGCERTCNGACLGPVFLECLADTTSATGGRCQSPATLHLDYFSDGGMFSVPVGYEVDISLQSIGPDGYGMQVALSSDAATVIGVIIPAGPVNPAGPAYLYRIKALSQGQVVVQIPHMSSTSDAAQRAYEVTLNIS
jgi:hypothetical protein